MTLAVADDDADAVRFASHKLKSSSAALGGLQLAELCRVLEERSSAGDLVGAKPEVTAIAGLCERVIEALLEASRKAA